MSVPAATNRDDATVWERFVALAATNGDRTALVEPDGTVVSFAQLVAAAESAAAGLLALDLHHTNNIGIFEPNRSKWLVTWLAAAKHGINVIGLNTRFRTAELDHLLDVANIDVVLAPTEFLGIDPPALFASLERSITVIADGEAGPFVSAGADAIDWSTFVSTEITSIPADARPGSRADLTIGFTTSGTTGFPKIACHTQHSTLHHVDAVIEAYGLTDATVNLLPLPLCGTFGFMTALPVLLAGGTVVLHDTWDPGEAARAVATHGVTFMTAADDMFSAMFNHPDFVTDTTLTVGGYADFTNAGRACVELAEARTEGRFRLAGVYGSSEGFALMCRWDGSSVDDRARNGGPLVSDDYGVRACDPETGAPLPHGEPGELQFTGANIIDEYLNNPEATAKAFTSDGWFRSGDLGHTIDDRTFIFQARLGDSLRLRGFLCDPSEIEHHLESHPAVDLAQVVGAKRPGDGDVAVAFVRLNPSQSGAGHHDVKEAAAIGSVIDQLQAHCRERLANYKRPEHIVIVDEFPVTDGPNGVKIRKVELRDRAAALIDPSS